jgi:hypothetical protein
VLAGSRLGDHQNEAINSSRVVHMTSVPAAMNSDCGVVGSCSSSDITEALRKLKGGRLINLARMRRDGYKGIGIPHRIALVASRLRNVDPEPP